MSNVEQINKLHNEAMDFADVAFVARLRGDTEAFKDASRLAYEKEAEAALLMRDDIAIEPTRSVLHRSAATLALDCGELREAERLISSALVGNPPHEIAEELRDLQDQVNFQRHLTIKGVEIQPDEIQVSFAGKEAAYGFALVNAVIGRIGDLEKLVHRTIERTSGKAFREGSGVSKTVQQAYSLYMGALRPGSLTMTFKIGRIDQLRLPGEDFAEDVGNIITDIIENLALVNEEKLEILQQKIPDADYYRNFVGLVKRIAPDGEAIRSVGLSTVRKGNIQSISFTKKQSSLPIVPPAEKDDSDEIIESTNKPIEILGRLGYADAIDAQEVKLVEASGRKWTIVVPTGLMRDIVRPFFEDAVVVTGARILGKSGRASRKILLWDIKAADL